MVSLSWRSRRVRAVAAALLLLLALVAGGWRWAATPSFSTDGQRTVFMGDSITRGWARHTTDLPTRGSWLRYVVTDEDSPWRFVANVAVRGQRLDEMAARFQRDVLDRDPAAVVILGGTNDALQGVPVQESLPHLRRMVDMAQAAGIDVWIVSPPPVQRPGVTIKPLRQAEQALADAEGVPWIDAVDAVGRPDGTWRPGMGADGVHPTERGARAFAGAVLDAVAAR